MPWPSTSRHVRGYGAAWDRLRLIVLKRDCGLCQTCRRAGLVAMATEVDHIKPKADGGDDHLDNLEAICREHHLEKTAREQGHERRVVTGADGWPVE